MRKPKQPESSKHPSEVLQEFLNYIDTCRVECKAAQEAVASEDAKRQDFLHAIEFETNCKARSKIATQEHLSRKRRRAAKDKMLELEKSLRLRIQRGINHSSKRFGDLSGNRKGWRNIWQARGFISRGEVWRVREIRWKSIKGWENYEVSSDGRVRSLAVGARPGTGNYARPLCEISQRSNNNGYLLVDLWKNGRRGQFLVHRLVAQAFLDNPQNFPVVNHKDENPKNNNVENLEWCTQKYNMNYGSVAKRIGKANSKSVLQMDKFGNVINQFPSASQAGRELDISNGSINDCLKGRRKSAGGYRWEYVT